MTPPRSAPPHAKALALSLLATAVIAALSLWFVSAAILPEMLAERAISPMRQALLSSGVQIGFVAGALASAVLGLPDRLHPGRLFALCAALAGAINATLIVVPVGSGAAIAARIATGALLAGVYPVGMKIAVGWGLRDRGFLVGILVGAVTIGSAVPHLFALGGGTDWRLTVSLASLAALVAAVLALFVGLGPHHATARRFDPTVVGEAWRNRRIRLAFLGYFGHMWELYAMWTWAGAALGASFATLMPEADALFGARLLTFLAVALGGIGCIAGGYVADRIGKETVAIIALAGSLASAVFCAFAFGGPPVIVAAAFLFWGLTIAPDSPQFSALVADFAAPRHAGSIMTLQTALGFALTFVTVQATPVLAGLLGWQAMILLLAAGPALGLVAMVRLRRLMRSQEDG
ncbi:MAG: MFS transporter [Stappia sp.]|uniref:MFS transporter n=1 Tax=Stappia sp. TaxID=1870903 RepID=UPI000C36DFF0|nr:MFS transporter [Stappia sp.]MAA98029.1 MFS transporter [Stappia sp.]MBM19975.1 MFS transporter [Stappia sp.]